MKQVKRVTSPVQLHKKSYRNEVKRKQVGADLWKNVVTSVSLSDSMSMFDVFLLCLPIR